jgi:hypothetical protein
MVTCCDLDRLNHFVERDNSLYPVYLNMVRAEIWYPGDDVIDSERLIAEEATLPGCARNIRYAALTINDSGLTNYGNYLVFWREEVTGYRASVFTDNCVMWRKRNGINLDEVAIPLGNRAIWEQKHMVAVSKCAVKIVATTSDDEFGEILLSSVSGAPARDEFVEVHIWGPLTRRSVAQVVRTAPDPITDISDKTEIKYKKAMLLRVKHNLSQLGISTGTFK